MDHLLGPGYGSEPYILSCSLILSLSPAPVKTIISQSFRRRLADGNSDADSANKGSRAPSAIRAEALCCGSDRVETAFFSVERASETDVCIAECKVRLK